MRKELIFIIVVALLLIGTVAATEWYDPAITSITKRNWVDQADNVTRKANLSDLKLMANVDYYINSSSGSDTNNGSSVSPFKTIQHAVDILPKDLNGYLARIRLQGGTTYNETVDILDFHNGDLFIQSVSGVVDWDGQDSTPVYFDNNRGWLYLNGIRFTNFTYAVTALRSKWVDVSGCYFDDGNTAIKADFDGHVWVDACENTWERTPPTTAFYAGYSSTIGYEPGTELGTKLYTMDYGDRGRGQIVEGKTIFANITHVEDSRIAATANAISASSLNLTPLEYNITGMWPSSDTIYYVDPATGSDSNPGTSGSPFQTVQHAFDIMPKHINSSHYACVQTKAGTYIEDVVIEGFYGGLLCMMAESYDPWTSVWNSTGSITVENCENFAIYQQGFKGAALTIVNSRGDITDNAFSNRSTGINVEYGSEVWLESNHDFDPYVHDTYMITASNGGIAHVYHDSFFGNNTMGMSNGAGIVALDNAVLNANPNHLTAGAVDYINSSESDMEDAQRRITASMPLAGNTSVPASSIADSIVTFLDATGHAFKDSGYSIEQVINQGLIRNTNTSGGGMSASDLAEVEAQFGANDSHWSNENIIAATANETLDVRLDGSRTMTGDLNMGNRNITNLFNIPQNNGDATSKVYVDAEITEAAAAMLSSAQDFAWGLMANWLNGAYPMTGRIDLGGFNASNASAPVVGSDLATKTYVDGLGGGMTAADLVEVEAQFGANDTHWTNEGILAHKKNITEAMPLAGNVSVPASSTTGGFVLFTDTLGHTFSNAAQTIAGLTKVFTDMMNVNRTEVRAEMNNWFNANVTMIFTAEQTNRSADRLYILTANDANHTHSENVGALMALFNRTLGERNVYAGTWYNLSLLINGTYKAEAIKWSSDSDTANRTGVKNEAALMDTDNRTRAASDAMTADKLNRTLWGNLSAMSQSMIPDNLNGATVVAPNSTDFTIGPLTLMALEFPDSASQINASFGYIMPASYTGGAVTGDFVWYSLGGSGTVKWNLTAYCTKEATTLNARWAQTPATVTDTMTALKTVHVSGVTGSLTPAGSPAASSMCWFQVGRDPTDTLTSSAMLLGVRIYYPII